MKRIPIALEIDCRDLTNRVYLYSATELQEITEALLVIAAQAREAYLIANNHFRGQAALNALDLRRRITHAPVNVPPQLLTVYPELRRLMQPAASSDGGVG